jgi:KDO2-lipid IV(A) lauroyltransferase
MGDIRSMAEVALVWPCLSALRWLPLPLAQRLANALGSALYHLTPRWRAVAHRNLALALPEEPERRRIEIVKGVYQNLARVLLALARMSRLDARNIRQWIDYEGLQHYEQALQAGHGVLFMTAHLGNWELSACAHALYGHPMNVMVRALDNPLLDRWLERCRTQAGNRTIRKQDAGRSVLRALRDNQAVGILVDQNTVGEDAVFVDFFGIKASATNGLARFARRTRAAVIPGFALWRSEDARYVLKFYPALEMQCGDDEEQDVIVNTQRCQAMIEQVIREHPEQWLWIHRRWKKRPPGEPPIY